MRKKKEIRDDEPRCRDCAHVVPVTDFHTLSVKGLPTLGRCPYYSDRYCVLLSQVRCSHYKEK